LAINNALNSHVAQFHTRNFVSIQKQTPRFIRQTYGGFTWGFTCLRFLPQVQTNPVLARQAQASALCRPVLDSSAVQVPNHVWPDLWVVPAALA
jgi:hypothetical protein